LASIAPLGDVVRMAGYRYSCDPGYDVGNIKLDYNCSIIYYGVPRITDHLIPGSNREAVNCLGSPPKNRTLRN